MQSLKSGKTEVSEIPTPNVGACELLVETSHSLVSSGTERMLVEFGKAGWLEKARQQPDKVRMVLDKMRTDGLGPTLESVFAKLEQPLPLGYCNVGRIRRMGEKITGFQVGDRVVSNGKHAEFVGVPQNLCALVPASVSDEEAAFAVLGAVALQGIRLAKPTLGESVVVMGAGLVGLMAIQLLRAHGCRVLAVDFDEARLKIASEAGAQVLNSSTTESLEDAVMNFSRGNGADAVIITLSSKSNEPVGQAARVSRKKGRIVLVGVAGLELSRADFYEKELSFQVSCSYGPGRYDRNYEEKGKDYPIAYVRWTEQRNFEAVLDMMAEGKLSVKPLISHRFPIEEAQKAYDLILSEEPSLGILLEYPSGPSKDETETVSFKSGGEGTGRELSLSFVGAGNYAAKTLIPAFRETGVLLYGISSQNGASGAFNGKKFGFEKATSNSLNLIEDESSKVIVVASRHETHFEYAKAAMLAGKPVFVEKPLCITGQDLDELEELYRSLSSTERHPCLMVGFNRRFSPHIRKIKELLSSCQSPKSFVMTVNAGALPEDHWIHDPMVGGGRIVGEACHFIDLLRFLSGAKIKEYFKTSMPSANSDSVSLQLAFADGSIGTVHYFANGGKSFPKERLEVFSSGRILQLDNFRKLRGFGWKGFRAMNLWKQDKGHRACVRAFVESIRLGNPPPIPAEEIFEVSRAAIDLQKNTCS